MAKISISDIYREVSSYLNESKCSKNLPTKPKIWNFLSNLNDKLRSIVEPETSREEKSKKSKKQRKPSSFVPSIPGGGKRKVETLKQTCTNFILNLDHPNLTLPEAAAKFADEHPKFKGESKKNDVPETPDPIITEPEETDDDDTSSSNSETTECPDIEDLESAFIHQSKQKKKPKSTVKLSQGQPPKLKQKCVIISDSIMRTISGDLNRTIDPATKVSTMFSCHASGGATIASLTEEIKSGDTPFTSADTVILHVGIQTVAGDGPVPTPTELRRQYVSLVSATRATIAGSPEIYLSHILPTRTDNADARSRINVANNIIDLAAFDTKCKVMNLNKHMFRGNSLKADYYRDDRHLNAPGAKYLSFRVREYFGLPQKPQQQRPPPTKQSRGYEAHFPLRGVPTNKPMLHHVSAWPVGANHSHPHHYPQPRYREGGPAPGYNRTPPPDSFDSKHSGNRYATQQRFFSDQTPPNPMAVLMNAMIQSVAQSMFRPQF